VLDSRFYGNAVVPDGQGLNESRGAAIFSMPLLDASRLRDVTGLVAGSAFSENAGIPVWEADPPSGPINDVRYTGNRFNPFVSGPNFGDRVYVNTLAAPNGLDPAGLNGLIIFRPARPATDKTDVVNALLPGMREGALLAVPSPNSVGAAPTAPTASYLAYAWTGGQAQVNAFQLSQKAGLLEASPGDFALAVDGTPMVSAKVLGTCTSGPFLCLAGNRFRAEAAWKSGTVSVPAQAVSVTADSGYFWFVDPASADLSVKVVDSRAQNGAFGVFFTGPTDVDFTLTITDTVTGAVKTYTHAVGAAGAVNDPTAFPAPRRKG